MLEIELSLTDFPSACMQVPTYLYLLYEYKSQFLWLHERKRKMND